MAKNGPGVALNRPQDTERYNAKDSIVSRAVKCSCLVSKTKWAMLGVLRPFIPAVLSVPAHHLVTTSSIRGRWRSPDHPWSCAEIAERILSGIKRRSGIIAASSPVSINNYKYLVRLQQSAQFCFITTDNFPQNIIIYK